MGIAGDANTKKNHGIANARRRKYSIFFLEAKRGKFLILLS
jgi:hypothetical protein